MKARSSRLTGGSLRRDSPIASGARGLPAPSAGPGTWATPGELYYACIAAAATLQLGRIRGMRTALLTSFEGMRVRRTGSDAVLACANEYLNAIAKLERYERREMSRRKTAIRALDPLRAS